MIAGQVFGKSEIAGNGCRSLHMDSTIKSAATCCALLQGMRIYYLLMRLKRGIFY